MLTKIQSDLERISEFDPGMWDLLRNKKIFATGCTGFIGTWIIYSFVYINQKFKLGSELYCLTRNKNKNEEKFPEIKFIEGDIQSFKFPEGQFDFVIHGAGEVSHLEGHSELVDISNIGTKRLINFSKNASVGKILFLSSGAAYGIQPRDLPFLEEIFPDAISKSAYGEAKKLAETLLFNEIIPVTSARIFTVCGPFIPLNSNFAFSNFMESILMKKKITITSNGKTTRSYLYAGDVVLWLWLLLLKGRDKEIYNVGSEEEISILGLAQKIVETLGKENEIEILGKELEFGRYLPSNKKIRREFNIGNLVSLEQGIKKSFVNLKDCYEF
jgi:nucleoside-diphosphate-sugar epimerase